MGETFAEGPMITWPGCSLQIDAGKFPGRIARLKKAASDAVAWTERVGRWLKTSPDLTAIEQNRREGLLEATRRGNVGLNISHQLDGAYE
jgi:hypothetical protein